MAPQAIKVGVIACCGEEIPEGTVARVATRLVLEKLRPNDTVTICLPLFLTGDRNESDFAKVYPTITVDGCDKLCAKNATDKLSGKPTHYIRVSDVAKKHPEIKLQNLDKLNDDEMRIAQELAEEIAAKVDQIINKATA
jgi:uncharacterized metal-binding protein